jgi:hypothetical protein
MPDTALKNSGYNAFVDYVLDPNTDKSKVNWGLAQQDFPDKTTYINLMMQDFGVSRAYIPKLDTVDPMQMKKMNVMQGGEPPQFDMDVSLGESLKQRGRDVAGFFETFPEKIPFPLAVAGGRKESQDAWWKSGGEYESGMVSLADFMKRFHNVGAGQIKKNPEGNLLKMLYNIGVGGGQLLGSLPQFFASDLPAMATRTVTPGEEGGLGQMGKEMLKDTADVAKYVYMKQAKTEEWKKWRKTEEGQRIETMIYEEPLRPLMAPMIFAGVMHRGARASGAFGELSQAKRLGFTTQDFLDMKRSGFDLNAFERRLEAQKGKVSERELPPGFPYQVGKTIIERPESLVETKVVKPEGDFAPFKKEKQFPKSPTETSPTSPIAKAGLEEQLLREQKEAKPKKKVAPKGSYMREGEPYGRGPSPAQESARALESELNKLDAMLKSPIGKERLLRQLKKRSEWGGALIPEVNIKAEINRLLKVKGKIDNQSINGVSEGIAQQTIKRVYDRATIEAEIDRLRKVKTKIEKQFPGESGKILLPETSVDIGELVRSVIPISRPGRTLNKSGIEAAEEMVQKTIKAETSYRILRGTASEIFEAAQKKAKLTKDDVRWIKDHFKDYYENDRIMPNDRIQIFADGFREHMSIYGNYAEGLGIKVRKRQFGQRTNYITDYLTPEGRRALEAGSGDVFQAIEAELNRRGKSTEGFRKLLVELQPGAEADVVRVHRSLEHPRLLELPDEVSVRGKVVKILEIDPFIISDRYLKSAGRRMGIIQYFGQGNKTVHSILDRIGDNPEMRQLVNDAWADLQGLSTGKQMPGALGTAGRGIEIAVRGQLLSLASLANVTGYHPIITKYGLRNTIKAFGETWTGSEGLEFNRRAGGWFKDMFEEHAATTDLEGRTGRFVKKELKWTGFEGINRNLNRVAGRAAQMAVEDALNMIRKGDTAGILKDLKTNKKQLIRQLMDDFYFTEADIARMTKEGMSRMDRARVAQRAPAIVNVMGESVLDRPSWMRKSIARRILAYTSFGRAMGNIMSDAVSQARKGNFKLLAKMTVGGLAAGETETFLKNWVKNRERTDKDVLDRLVNDLFASMTLGLPGIAAERIRWGWDVTTKGPIASNLPPGLEVLDEFIVDLVTAMKERSFKKGLQAVVKPVQAAHAIGGTAHRLIDPKGAEKARMEKKRETYDRMYRPDFNEAIRKRDFDKARKIRKEAMEHGVYLKYPHLKPKEEPNMWEILGTR